jgi:hypothetical protein
LVGGILSVVQSVTGSLTRLIDPLGNVIQRTLDKAGNILSQVVVGTVGSFSLLSSSVNSIGQTVQRLSDPVSGAIVDVTYSAQNISQIISVDIVNQGK